MPHKTLRALSLISGLLLSGMPVWAHHSFAKDFDADKPVTVKGVVNSVKWENPHSLIYVDVKENGKLEKWTFEAFPPGVLYRKGLRQDRLKPGAEVTMMGFRARDGSNFANLSLVVFPAEGKYFCVQFPSGANAGASVPIPGTNEVCGGTDTGQYR